jgi:assimilatory nitrate reductase electron transfer subunit
VGVDRHRQTVRLDSGEVLPYDRLVFAVGARANVPTLGGLERARRDRNAVARNAADMDAGAGPLPHGVLVMRTLEDAEELRQHLGGSTGASVVVLGAGVLGMELALAAAEAGASVSIVYHDAVPMGRNLDDDGGRVLARLAQTKGIRTHAHARAEEVVVRYDERGRAAFSALVCADGRVVSGDILALSCGVSPRTELAVAAGLRVSTGILVDDELRSWTDPDIFAIGDCAQVVATESVDRGILDDPTARVPGAPSGLIGPGWRQAEWLADAIAADARAHQTPAVLDGDRPAVVMLKAEGIDAVAAGEVTAGVWDRFTAGDCSAHPGSRVAVWADPVAGRYVKTVSAGGMLVGFVAIGMPRAGAELALVYQRGGALPSDPSLVLRLDGPDAERSVTLSGDAVVCLCNGVTARSIGEAAEAGCETVDEVGARTRAGTGCGGCRERIQELIVAMPVPALD